MWFVYIALTLHAYPHPAHLPSPCTLTLTLHNYPHCPPAIEISMCTDHNLRGHGVASEVLTP